MTLKRWRRFRASPRAFWSLWLLLGIYLVSLCAELVCNDRPLYLRFNGRSYFPAFRYYPDDTFTGSGQQTRPNYRALAASDRFRAGAGNRAVFAPVPFGPLENLNPASLQAEEEVVAAWTPVPFVGYVDVGADLVVRGALAAGPFFGTNDEAVAGGRLDAHWPVPEPLRAAVQARLRNEAAPALTVAAQPLRGEGPAVHLARAELSVSAFQPRAQPPSTVRVTLRQPVAGLPPVPRDAFRRATLPGPDHAAWVAAGIGAPARGLAARAVREAFEGLVEPVMVREGSAQYRLTVAKNDIRWPYPPVRGHWMGIDSAGRDVLARILYGLRTSLTFGLLLVMAAISVGTFVGSIQGYYAGKTDIACQRMIEIWSALPFLYVMILLGSIYGRSFVLLLVCYGLFNWIGMSFYIRGEFFRLRVQPFVEAARCLGVPARRIMWRHILPNALTPIITFFPFQLVGAVGSLAALDYLGFGLPPPTPSWGELLRQAQEFRWAWWLILYPSLALFAVMLMGVFIGEGVREAYDPRPYSRME